jgi:alkanesulfonate monooxygenase SsuD/methylene tetrahydromethanopterin reductase-like flavin-dependent oxidoreductase (luciferase family)
VLIAIGAIVADTEAEARHLHASQRLRRLLRGTGESGPIPTPEEAERRLGDYGVEGLDEASEWPRMFVGDVEQVKTQIEAMSGALGVDDVMAVTVVHSHAARRHSYELLAQAFGLEGA